MRRRTPEAPTRSRFGASGGAAKSAGGRPAGGRPRGGRRDDRKGEYKENPLPAKEVSYTPASVILDSLLPLVPATPLTLTGLSNVLIRETERVCGRKIEKWGRQKWSRYDRTREVFMRVAVQGGYNHAGEEGSLVAEKERDTVVGEARRMAARNGTIGARAMRTIVREVRAKVGVPKPEVKPDISAP